MSEQPWQDCFTLQADNSHTKLPWNLNLPAKFISPFTHLLSPANHDMYVVYLSIRLMYLSEEIDLGDHRLLQKLLKFLGFCKSYLNIGNNNKIIT